MYLVPSERLTAGAPILSAFLLHGLLPTRDHSTLNEPARGASEERRQIPVFERLVQASANQPFAVRSERHAVHRIRVSPQPLHQLSRVDIPDPDDGVERPSGDEPPGVGNCDRCHASVHGFGFDDGELLVCAVFHVPHSSGLVAGTGDDDGPIPGEVEGVDLLLMAGKDLADGAGSDLPDLGWRVSERQSEVVEYTL